MANEGLKEKTVHAAVQVKFEGEQITLPKGMELSLAITTLMQFQNEQEKVVAFNEVVKVFPWDGANALRVVLEKKFGWVAMNGAERSIEVGPNEKVNIPWGELRIPNFPARFYCDGVRQNGNFYFRIVAEAKRKCEEQVKEIFKLVQEYVESGGSIYQGKTVKLSFPEDEIAMPTFIDPTTVDTKTMAFSPNVSEQLDVNLFTPIERVADLKASHLPVKRAVLLAGTFGTGKTLASTQAAKIANSKGVTFLYIERASELAQAIQFAKMYSNPAAVIFCEDVDRATSGSRDEEMDELLNTVDGLDTKSSRIMIVMTTNDVKSIHPAMLRPGRLDAVIEITPPDAETAARIIRGYCGDTLDEDEDLAEVGRLLNGQIPAVLAEVVKRAKLAQLSIQTPGSKVKKLSAEALERSARGMSGQLKLLQDRIDDQQPRIALIREAVEKQALDVLRSGAKVGESVVRESLRLHLTSEAKSD